MVKFVKSVKELLDSFEILSSQMLAGEESLSSNV